MYDRAYGAITLVYVPRAVFIAALTLGYHVLGNFYTPDGTRRSVKNLRARVPRGTTEDTMGTWPRYRDAVLWPLVGAPGPPMAANPRDVGTKRNMAGHNHGSYRWVGGQDRPGKGGVPVRHGHTSHHSHGGCHSDHGIVRGPAHL